MSENIFDSIIKRTKGEFYIGVVGSVRSGKSAFIRRLVEKKILPLITDDYLKNKVTDELPQSAEGKTIMTVEPKFIPSNTIPIIINNDTTLNFRLVDSVGYMIPNAIGNYQDDVPRMVKTPWFEELLPFDEAAEIGTKKVITNHSSLGILITSDGSFGEFSRKDYEVVEEKLVLELKETNKPFIIVLNTNNPLDQETIQIRNYLYNKYQTNVVVLNALQMEEMDIDQMFKCLLDEFPINELDIKIPSWITVLDNDNKVKKEINEIIVSSTEELNKFKHVDLIKNNLSTYDLFKSVNIKNVDATTGNVIIEVEFYNELYQEILTSFIGDNIDDKGQFINLLQEYKKGYDSYKKIKCALEMVDKTGYGISLPTIDDLKLENPSVIKQGNRYGVKIKAVAPSIHMIKVDVESTFEPIIGSEEQSRILIDNLVSSNEEAIWENEIFGRSLSDIVQDGIRIKLNTLPNQAKTRFKETLEKIVNLGSGGVIAIIL